METLQSRLAKRFEDEICRVCVHKTSGTGCTLTRRRECPIFEWAEKLTDVVKQMWSERLSDYMEQIQSIICPECAQDPQGACEDRDHLDCPLDLYHALVIEILEQEIELTGRRRLKDRVGNGSSCGSPGD